MEGFRRMTLDDTDILYDIIDREKYPTGIRDMVHRLRNPYVTVFIDDTNQAIMVYEPVYGVVPWTNGHVYSTPKIRGRKLMEFYLRTGLHMAYHTDTEVITVVVPEWLGRRHSLWMANCGFTKQWDLLGNQMWTADLTQVQDFEDRLERLQSAMTRSPEAQEAGGTKG